MKTFFLTLLFIALGGCSKPLDSKLKIQLTADPVSLDPTFAEDGLSLLILSNVMDGLVGYDGKGRLVRRVSDRYIVSQSGRRYVFHIREGASWSDGHQIRAEDFVVGLKRALAPGSVSKLAELLMPIRGARRFRAREARELEGVSVVAGELVIELEQSAPYFIGVLALPVAYPIRQDVLDGNGGKWPVTAPSTGIYRITEYKTTQFIDLSSWRKSAGPQNARFQIVQDESTGVSLFERGQLDILTRIGAQDLKRLKEKGVLHTNPFFATYFVGFNVKTAPFNDVYWRRAVAGSIQKEELCRAMFSEEVPASSWIPHGLEGFYPYRGASEIFASAIARVRMGGGKTPPITAEFNSGTRERMVMEKIQKDVEARLGVTMALQGHDWKSYVQRVTSRAPQMYRFGWLAPFEDPLSHLEAFMSGNPNNHSGWSNAEYDTLVREIAQIAPGPRRFEKIVAAQKILVEDQAVVVPLYHYKQHHAAAERVKAFHVNAYGVIRLEELRVQF